MSLTDWSTLNALLNPACGNSERGNAASPVKGSAKHRRVDHDARAQLSTLLAKRRQEREKLPGAAMWDRVTQGEKLTEHIRRLSVVLWLAKRRHDRQERHPARTAQRTLLAGRGLGARRRKLGALPSSHLRTEERAQTFAATNFERWVGVLGGEVETAF